MKRLLLLTAISFSSMAYADNGFYTSLKAGISDTKFDNSKDQISLTESDDGYKQTWHYNDADKSIYPNISAAVGFDFSKISNVNARAELEYTYKDKAKFNPDQNTMTFGFEGNYITIDTPKGLSSLLINELRTQSLMVNTYYDFKNSSKFTPYLSVGAGVTRIKNTQTVSRESEGDNLGLSDTSNSFTWSAGAGVAYKVTENVALDLAYRYVDAGEVEFKNNILQLNAFYLKSTADLASHDYSLGIRYNF